MAFSSSPNRANCVNDKTRRQPKSASNFRFTGLATAERPAFCEQLRPGRAMNRTINSSATEERHIRRVHDRIHFELRDVAPDNIDLVVWIFPHEAIVKK